MNTGTVTHRDQSPTGLAGAEPSGVETLDERTTHIPGRTEAWGARLYHASQKGSPFKTYGLLISGIFHVRFLDCSCLWVTDTGGRNAVDAGERPSVSVGVTPFSPGSYEWGE